jgi:hypothetical protein
VLPACALKQWYQTLTLHGATMQKTMNSIFTTMKISNLATTANGGRNVENG